MKRLTPFWISLLGFFLWGCRSKAPEARLPTDKEVAAESVVVNYGPRLLRVFPIELGSPVPDATKGAYLILASERPQLPAVFRSLGVTMQAPLPGFIARAGTLAFATDHVVQAAAVSPPSASPDPLSARFVVYDKEGKVGVPRAVALPAPCTQDLPPLVQADAGRVYALVRCLAEKRAIVLTLDPQAHLLSARVQEGVAQTEVFLHQPEADYLLAGRQVLRVSSDGSANNGTTIGTVPPPGPDNTAETRELVRAGELLLIVDGAAGRVIAMDALRMGWRFEKRFFISSGSGGRVVRLRAALAAPDRLHIVTAEATRHGQELFATVLPLDSADGAPPPRVFLGPAVETGSDHEVVPVAPRSGGGSLLVYSHRGNTGPLVALRRLSL
jgi:hypothetical protein